MHIFKVPLSILTYVIIYSIEYEIRLYPYVNQRMSNTYTIH